MHPNTCIPRSENPGNLTPDQHFTLDRRAYRIMLLHTAGRITDEAAFLMMWRAFVRVIAPATS